MCPALQMNLIFVRINCTSYGGEKGVQRERGNATGTIEAHGMQEELLRVITLYFFFFFFSTSIERTLLFLSLGGSKPANFGPQ